MYHHCACATPGFLRGMLRMAIANDAPLAALQRHGALLKVEHLRDLARRGALRHGVDVDALAAQITRLNTFMMYEWVLHGDAGELKAQMANGNKLLLRGAMRPHAAERLEAWTPVGCA
jgi:hypothetical protein